MSTAKIILLFLYIQLYKKFFTKRKLLAVDRLFFGVKKGEVCFHSHVYIINCFGGNNSSLIGSVCFRLVPLTKTNFNAYFQRMDNQIDDELIFLLQEPSRHFFIMRNSLENFVLYYNFSLKTSLICRFYCIATSKIELS